MTMLVRRLVLAFIVAAALQVTACATFDPPQSRSTAEQLAKQLVIGSDGLERVAVLELGRLRLYDTNTGAVIAEGVASARSVVASRIAKDGAIVLLSGRGELAIQRPHNGGLVESARGRWEGVDRVRRLALGADGTIAVADPGRVAVWPRGEIRGTPIVLALGAEPYDMAFRPTDGALGIAFADRVEVWDVARAARVGTLPRERRVAFSSRGDAATGYARVFVREAMDVERPLAEPAECEEIVWSGSGDAIACLAPDAAWICVRTRCDVVDERGSVRPFDFVAPTPGGFLFSAGDGRVLRHALDGRDTWLIVDAVHDLPGGAR